MNAVRQPVSKKTRFEVFKRDKFTCQYCGAKAPDAVLHVDHIKPVADGGLSDILNLLTACASCNGGKGARPLEQSEELDKQRDQLAQLQERREQIEMMLEWRDELAAFKDDNLDIICRKISERSKFVPNENGRSTLRKLLKRHSLEDILAAVEESFDAYLEYVKDEATESSWEKAFSKIPGVISVMKQKKDKPYLVRLFYIQGILRRRLHNRYLNCVSATEEMVLEGVPVDTLELLAKRSDSWDDFVSRVDAYLATSNDDGADG